jgi:hypothetical protein
VLPLKSHNWRKNHFESRKLLLKRILPLIVATIDDRSGVSGCSGSQAANAISSVRSVAQWWTRWFQPRQKLCKIPKRKYEQQQHLILRMSPSVYYGPVLQDRPPQDGDDEAVAGPRVGGGTLGQGD